MSVTQLRDLVSGPAADTATNSPPHACRADFTGTTEQDIMLLGRQLGLANVSMLMEQSPRVRIRMTPRAACADGSCTKELTLRFHPTDLAVRKLSAELRRDVYGMLRHRQRDGGVLVDIGGHVGTSALIYAALHPGSHVHTFEPAPINFFYLAWNVIANGWTDAITMRHAGLSTDGAPFELEYSPDDSMSTRRASLGATFGSLPKVTTTVRTVKLHTLLRECGLGKVGAVKLDCEGCEFDLVPSARDFFGSERRRIMGEFHARHVRMKGHEGNVSEEVIASTWRLLCERPKGRGDCVEWLACLRSRSGALERSGWYADPNVAWKRALRDNATSATDVRVCSEAMAAGVEGPLDMRISVQTI
mmetsp:Transcript_7527/g.16500  ORF Transcript_7527/g.16500 Transcript_7527/m.16500 type:complete len:361 (-) Transcript_7527:365-1447(-)|eukprot:CAMPEP_0183343664 /NCGR_PEP_ID=MMETSP0164_2-20130417/9515_1 /TAXON_ID=221442 /ORGANISM="Coccolithus pelagicus ssp braarudi, Strain PLY182g" /LENGTH=360 /DNA_ID=CAMNT_0025514533 /DNA_START=188 /DNA_END=1270 /DNA_ORIENTATION=-